MAASIPTQKYWHSQKKHHQRALARRMKIQPPNLYIMLLQLEQGPEVDETRRSLEKVTTCRRSSRTASRGCGQIGTEG
jgi:hypothetical protein